MEGHNQWYQWELDEIVELRVMMERIIKQVLIGGLCLPIASWKKERRSLLQLNEYEFDATKPISTQIQAALQLMFENKDFEISGQPGQGIFTIDSVKT